MEFINLFKSYKYIFLIYLKTGKKKLNLIKYN